MRGDKIVRDMRMADVREKSDEEQQGDDEAVYRGMEGENRI